MINLNYFKDDNIRCHWQLCICKESMRKKQYTINEVEKLFNDFQNKGKLLKQYNSYKNGYKLSVVRLNKELIAIFLCVKNEYGTQNGQMYLSDTTDEDMLNLAKCFTYNSKVMGTSMLKGEPLKNDRRA